MNLDIVSYQKKAEVLFVFQSDSGYSVNDYFPTGKIKVNTIDYIIKEQKLCACNGLYNVIDGDKLIENRCLSIIYFNL